MVLLAAGLSGTCGRRAAVGKEGWDRAVQAARADREAADPDGIYFAAFVKKLAQVQGPALQSCRGLHPATASADFQAVARLSAEGSVDEILISPISGFHDCVKQKLRVVTLPRPPKSPYWIFWGTSGLH